MDRFDRAAAQRKAEKKIAEYRSKGEVNIAAQMQVKEDQRKDKKFRKQRRKDWRMWSRVKPFMEGFFGPDCIVWYERGEDSGLPDTEKSHPDAVKVLEVLNLAGSWSEERRDMVLSIFKAAIGSSRLLSPYRGPGDLWIVPVIRKLLAKTTASQRRIPWQELLPRLAGFAHRCDTLRSVERTQFMPAFDIDKIFNPFDMTYRQVWIEAVRADKKLPGPFEYVMSIKPFFDPQMEFALAPPEPPPPPTPSERLSKLLSEFEERAERVRADLNLFNGRGYFDRLSLREQRIHVLGVEATDEVESLEKEVCHDPAVQPAAGADQAEAAEGAGGEDPGADPGP